MSLLIIITVISLITSIYCNMICKPTKISIIGGGMSGLSIAMKFIKKNEDNNNNNNKLQIDIYDTRQPGFALASSVAAGLMHPLTPRGSLIWKGERGYEESMKLLNIIQNFIGVDKKLYKTNELLIRPFSTIKEYEMYKRSALNIPQWIQMIDVDETAFYLGNHAVSDKIIGSAIIKNSIHINCPMYLKGMWDYINANSDANWITKDIVKEEFTSLCKRHHDIVIASCSTGIASLYDRDDNDLVLKNIQNVRGQNLFIKMNDQDKMNNIISGQYVTCSELNDEKIYVCGATHEYMKEMKDLQGPININVARNMLMDGLSVLHKDLKDRDVIGANTGVRLVTPKSKHGRLPFIRRHKTFNNTWFVGGFGSHGLIHHALIADVLTESILFNNINCIFQELLEYNLEVVPRSY